MKIGTTYVLGKASLSDNSVKAKNGLFLNPVNKQVILRNTEDYHEDLGLVVFVSFGKDENGEILGEPPEVYAGYGYLDCDFDEVKWDYFFEINFNSLFEQADPVNYPPTEQSK